MDARSSTDGEDGGAPGLCRAARSGSDDGERFPHLGKIAKDVPRTFGGIPAPEAAWGAPRPGAFSLSGAAERWARTYLRWDFGEPPRPPDAPAASAGKRARRLARMLNVGSELFGYKQGMNFVAGTLLTECEALGRGEGVAFALYAYLLRQLHVERLYGRSLATYLAALELALRRHAPRLHAHLRSEGFEPQLYGVEWFSALFVISVPKVLSLCLLDLVYARVEDAPLRLAVAVLKNSEADLLALRSFDDLVAHFKDTVRRVRPRQVLVELVAARAQRRVDTLRALGGGSSRPDWRPPGSGANAMLAASAPATRRANAVATPFGAGAVVGLGPDGVVAVKLDWGGVARVPKALVDLDGPPPPASPNVPAPRPVAPSRPPTPPPPPPPARTDSVRSDDSYGARRDFNSDY